MRLYLIKRRVDGWFLRTIEAYYSLHTGQDKTAWSPKPQQMLRTPDGVAANLRKLCSTPYREPSSCYNEIDWKDFDPEKLRLYEIVVMDVDVISMTATPAQDFVQIDTIATTPLNKRERWEGVNHGV